MPPSTSMIPQFGFCRINGRDEEKQVENYFSFDLGQPRAFSVSGRKLARMELAASRRSSSRVKPCSVWASRYSLARSEPKKAGSSELSVTRRPRIEVAAQRMGGKRGADAGADVRRGVQFQGRAPHLQLLEQRWVLNGRERVADALGADGERLPDGLGAGGFAGVVGEAQAGVAGLGVEIARRARSR